MVENVSLLEISNFLNSLFRGFDEYIFLAFGMMLFFNIAIFTKYILSGTK